MARLTFVPVLNTPGDMKRLLAHRVREARLVMGWKQSTLAKRAGVSVPTMSRFERTGATSLENFLKICHALGRLDGVAELLKPDRAQSLAALEKQLEPNKPKRGRK